ncbi:MAG: hypothetical protein AAF532_15665 [Planctomycetota bacterium]
MTEVEGGRPGAVASPDVTDRMTESMNVLALVKGGQQYVFMYDASSRDALLAQLGKFAADEELNLSWSDAALLGRKARAQSAAYDADGVPVDDADEDRIAA